MKLRHLLVMALSGLLLTTQSLHADHTVTLDYQFTGDTGVGLSSMMGGPLSISEFTDQREIEEKNNVSTSDGDVVILAQPPAQVIQQAFQQAFESSDAQLDEGDTPLTLSGKLLEMEIEETAAGVVVLIRSELTLDNQGRNAWQSVIFSRVESEGDDVAAAINQALDRLVNELFLDDYFLMELGIF